MDVRLGTAQWADPDFVEEKYRYRSGTFWLGRSASDNDTPLGFDDDRHVCLVSGTRGGKGTTSIINNLCLWPGSIVVVDPKGENTTITAARRGRGSEFCEGMGQKVVVLDPFRKVDVDDSYRARFNPLDALSADNPRTPDHAARLADAIMVFHEKSQDPFWEESARSIVKGLILHVLTDPIYEGRRNLTTVRKLIVRGDWEAVEALRSLGQTEIASAHRLLWEAVMKNPAFGERVADIGHTFVGMLTDNAEGYQSMLQTANRNTEFIDGELMEECLEASDFKLSELKTDPNGMSLYLSLPQSYMSTHYRWLRVMIGLIMIEMEAVRGQPASGHPVLMVLDEFAGLKRMESIETGVAHMAGFGLKMFFVLQTLVQLKTVYGDGWETFLGNCGLRLFFGIDDNTSVDYVSKMLGDTEVIREVRSQGANSSESDSLSQSESESLSRSSSSSRSESDGVSESYGQSLSEGTNRSTGGSVSHGVNKSHSRTSGGSISSTSSRSWTPGSFANRSDSGTVSHSSSTSDSEGTSDSWTRSESEGTSRGSSVSLTQGASRTLGLSKSETSGTTTGTTRGETHGSTRGETAGTAETIHRRPLCAPYEIARLFCRIDDKRHRAYPGLGLAVIKDQAPVAFRRVHYFEDVQFIGYFQSHPDHLFNPPRREVISKEDLEKYEPWLSFNANSWMPVVKRGTIVRAGDVIAYAGMFPTLRDAPVRASRSGRVVSVPEMRTPASLFPHLRGSTDPMWLMLGPDTPVLTGDFEILCYENGEAALDPFADVAAYCRRLEDGKARQAKIAAQKKAAEERATAEQREHEEELQETYDRMVRSWKLERNSRQKEKKKWQLAMGAVALPLLVDICWTVVTGNGAGIAGAAALLWLLTVFWVKYRLVVAYERAKPEPPASWRDVEGFDLEAFSDSGHQQVKITLDVRIYWRLAEFGRWVAAAIGRGIARMAARNYRAAVRFLRIKFLGRP